MIQRLMDIIDKDKNEADPAHIIQGNFQFFEVCEGLFSFYNNSSINLYLTWNQELPLMVDATGLRIRTWRQKKKWYVHSGPSLFFLGT